MTRTRYAALLLLALSFAGCSAIVSPDRSQLGSLDGDDASTADGEVQADADTEDAGRRRDAAMPSDATIPPPFDSSVALPDATVGMDATIAMDANITTPDATVVPLDSSVTPLDAGVDATLSTPDATVTPDASATAGDTCTSAISVTFPALTTTRTFEGSFGSFAADYASPCIARDPGSDVVFVVDVPAGNDLQIDTDGSGADTVLSLSKTCPAAGGSFGLVCNDDVGSSSAGPFFSRVWLHNTTPLLGGGERYYVLLKTFDIYSTADYRIRFSVRLTAVDTCSGSPLNITGGGTVYGVTTNLSSWRNGTCGSTNKLEAAFRVDVSEDASPQFFAMSSDFSPVLYIRSTCGNSSGDEQACATSSFSTATDLVTALEFERDELDNDSYRLFVDGASSGDVYILDYIP